MHFVSTFRWPQKEFVPLFLLNALYGNFYIAKCMMCTSMFASNILNLQKLIFDLSLKYDQNKKTRKYFLSSWKIWLWQVMACIIWLRYRLFLHIHRMWLYEYSPITCAEILRLLVIILSPKANTFRISNCFLYV